MRRGRGVLTDIAAITAFVLFIGLVGAGIGHTKTVGPGAFVEDFGDRTITLLEGRESLGFDELRFRFHALMTEGFDMKTISRFILGRYARALSNEEVEAYEELFTDIIVHLYFKRFQHHDGATIEIVDVIENGGADSVVRTKIWFANPTHPIRADWVVRNSARGYKIVDVRLEGISMLITKRAEFAYGVERKGVHGLLDELRAWRNELAVEQFEARL